MPADQAYSVIYGPWSAQPAAYRGYACTRYQALDAKTGKQLSGWTYSATDLAGCDLAAGTLGPWFASTANISTSLCCATNDCNAPDNGLDTATTAGPTVTAALAEGALIEQALLSESSDGDEDAVLLPSTYNGTMMQALGVELPAGYSDANANPDVTADLSAAGLILESGSASPGDWQVLGVYGGGDMPYLLNGSSPSGELEQGTVISLGSTSSTGSTASGVQVTPSQTTTESSTAVQYLAGSGTAASPASNTSSTSSPASNTGNAASMGVGTRSAGCTQCVSSVLLTVIASAAVVLQ